MDVSTLLEKVKQETNVLVNTKEIKQLKVQLRKLKKVVNDFKIITREQIEQLDDRMPFQELRDLVPKMQYLETRYKIPNAHTCKVVRSVGFMLLREPSEADEDLLDFWRQLGPVPIETFDSTWQKVDQKQPLFNGSSRYDEWLHYGNQTFGMRRMNSGQIEGIVRVISPRFIWEATYKNSKLHGFYREIGINRAYIRLYKDGSNLAEVSFNRQLIEKTRKGPDHLVQELIPSTLQLVQSRMRAAIREVSDRMRREEELRQRQQEEADWENKMEQTAEDWKKFAMQATWPELDWLLDQDDSRDYEFYKDIEMLHLAVPSTAYT